MDDLVTWLRAQFDEDERVAQGANDGEVDWIASDASEHGLPGMGAHIERWVPSRVEDEVEAKRQLILAIGNYEAKIDGEWGCCHDRDQILAGECRDAETNGIPPALRLLARPARIPQGMAAMRTTVTTTEASSLLGVDPRSFTRWARRRGIRPVHRVRVGRSTVTAWSMTDLAHVTAPEDFGHE